jgi:hypothetical protein
MLKGDAGSGADTGAYRHTGQQRTQGDAENQLPLLSDKAT